MCLPAASILELTLVVTQVVGEVKKVQIVLVSVSMATFSLSMCFSDFSCLTKAASPILLISKLLWPHSYTKHTLCFQLFIYNLYLSSDYQELLKLHSPWKM